MSSCAYDIIETGYNIADETVNFGNRYVAEDNNLFEACTLATLKCSDQEQQLLEGNGSSSSPHICSKVHNGQIYVSIDTCLRIFKNKEDFEVLFDITFDQVIDVFRLSSDGRFLLICLRNGMLHVLDSKAGFSSVFSGSAFSNSLCEPSQNVIVSAFMEENRSNIRCFIITRPGVVYRLVINIDGNAVACNSANVFDFSSEIDVACISYPFLLASGEQTFILDLDDESLLIEEPIRIKRAFPLDYVFIALLWDGALVEICCQTLLMVKIPDSTTYEDILLFTDEKMNNKQLIAVTRYDEKHFIQLCNFPGLAEVYSLEVPNNVHLITPGDVHDEILYVSEGLQENTVAELRFHMIYETQPLNRLERLLRKQRYDEAEDFAKRFSLDFALIRKAKAEAIVDKDVCTSDDINDLIRLLDSIDDVIFKLQCCLNVECGCGDFKDVRRVLLYGCNLTAQDIQGEEKDQFESLQENVFRLMYKFDTFITMNGDSCSTQDWSSFQSCDVISELHGFLNNYEIDKAIILYSRVDEIEGEDIDTILAALNRLPMKVYEPFLPTFIPKTVVHHPDALSSIVKWTCNKIMHLEENSKSDFPSNAIRFVENITKLLHLEDYMPFIRHTCYKYGFQQRIRDSLDTLAEQLFILRKLKFLQSTYNILVPMAEYLAGPNNVIRTLLNTEMFPEDFELLLKEFLFPFIVENQMEPNQIFLNEIIRMVTLYEEKYWTSTIGPILNCMTSLTVKLQATKAILTWSSVPWSDSIRKVGQSALTHSDPLVMEIRQILDDEPMLVVLRKPCYKIKESQITSMQDFKMIVGRIIYCNEPTLVQDVFSLCKTPQYKHEANMMLMKHFVGMGALDEAVRILDNNTLEETKSCMKEIITFCELVVNDEINCGLPKNNYCEFLAVISQRLNTDLFSVHEYEALLNLIDTVKNVHDLNTHFDLKIPSYRLQYKQAKHEALIGCIKPMQDNNDLGTFTEETLSACHKLARCLNLAVDRVVVEFCKICCHRNAVVEAAAYVINMDSTAVCLGIMALLILRSQDQSTVANNQLDDDSSLLDSSSFEMSKLQTHNTDILQRLCLARAAAVKALMVTSEDEDLTLFVDVFKWSNVVFGYLQANNNDLGELKKVLFGDVYDCVSAEPECSTFSTLNFILDRACGLLGQSQNGSLDFLTKCPQNSEDNRDVYRMIESLNMEGQHLMSLKLLLAWATETSTIISTDNINKKIPQDLLQKQCVPNVLQMCLNNNTVDPILIYDLLFLFAKTEDGLRFLQASLRLFKRQPKKFKQLLLIGINYWDFHGISSGGKRSMMKSLLTIKWWERLESKKLNYDNFFKILPEQRMELLLNSDHLDVKSIEEYCRDFELDVQTYYLLYLKKLLCNWQPAYETILPGDKQCAALKVLNDETDLYKKCLQVIAIIDNKNDIVNALTAIWNSVNFYYYEIFITIVNILTTFNAKMSRSDQLSMLLFLKSYRRTSVPTETEREQWFTAFPDTGALSPLSEYRLPFTQLLFTKDISKIIRPEINLNTYKFWLEATTVVKNFLSKDEICYFVVKEIVSSGMLVTTNTNETGWSLTSNFEDVFAKIDECIQHVTDFEKATATLYHLMTHTPSGADQVSAAKLCYKYATSYKRLNPDHPDVDKVFNKIQKKYYHFSALHILHKHKLAEEKYISMVAYPQDLIVFLYMDDRILRRDDDVNIECPDFNGTVKALASLFDINFKKVQYQLVNSLLFDVSMDDTDFEASMSNFSVMLRNKNDSLSEEDVITRAAYICQSGDLSFWRGFLLKIGQDDTSDEQKNVSCRVKALKVFVLISDDSAVETLTGVSYEDFMNEIDKLTLLSNMQRLGIGLQMDSLYKSSKKALFNRLLTKEESPLCIKTMGLLCMTYTMYDYKYWKIVINGAMKLSMFAELKTYLQFLRNRKFEFKDFYVNAWKKLIDNAFLVLNNLPKDRHGDALCKIVLMIQACPVLYSLDFERMLQHCLKLDKPKFAAVFLQYIPEEKRNAHVQNILNLTEERVNLDELKKKGIWGVSLVETIFTVKTYA